MPSPGEDLLERRPHFTQQLSCRAGPFWGIVGNTGRFPPTNRSPVPVGGQGAPRPCRSSLLSIFTVPFACMRFNFLCRQ